MTAGRPGQSCPEQHGGRRRTSALLATALAVAACGGASPPGAPLHLPAARHLPLSRGSRVVVILMENKELGDLLGNASAPYLNSLARHGGLATASFAITHPSLPNYIALTSGSTHGISSDCTACTVNAPNLTDQLDRAGVSWKAYLEDVPGPCFTGD